MKSQSTQVIEIYRKSTNFKKMTLDIALIMKMLKAVLANIFITLLAKIISFGIFIFSIAIPSVPRNNTTFRFSTRVGKRVPFNRISWLKEFRQGPDRTYLLQFPYLAMVAPIHVQEFLETSCDYPSFFESRDFVIMHNHSIHR